MRIVTGTMAAINIRTAISTTPFSDTSRLIILAGDERIMIT
jgi:hypothetical protein